MGFLIKSGIFALVLITEIFGRSLLQEDENELIGFDAGIPTDCNCERRYHKHYETKGCEIEEIDSCGCPTKYVCPSATDTTEQTVCIYENEEYKIGSKIRVIDACQVCRCVAGQPPRISCRTRECPQLDPVDGENCFLVYSKERCCPMRYECVMETTGEENEEESSVCVHENVTYPFGAKIYPSEDPCVVCECHENWNGVEDASCRRQNCMFERNKHRLDAGCIPVYHETKCCPIEFYCPDKKEMSGTMVETYDIEEGVEDDGMQCVFDGKSYEYGTELRVEHSCIRCRCSVPPDFTCVHQSCPRPPNTAHCVERYRSNECCPHYECFFGDGSDVTESNDTSSEILPSVVLEAMDVAKRSTELERSGHFLFSDNTFEGNGENTIGQEDGNTLDNNQTSEIVCPTPICADETCLIEILPGHECPTCVCQVVCPTPICADETCIIEIPPGHQCPTCVCQESNIREKNPLEHISDVESENATEIMTLTNKENDNSDLDHEFLELASEEKSEQDEGRRLAPMAQEDDLGNGTLEAVGEDEVPERTALVEEGDSPQETIIVDSGTKPAVNSRGPRRKRSRISGSNQTPVIQQQWSVFADDEEEEELQSSLQRVDSSETEREQDESNENFDDELRLFPRRTEATEAYETSLESVRWESEVPGCPTPLCANSSCRIGILPGHACPTCICARPEVRQP